VVIALIAKSELLQLVDELPAAGGEEGLKALLGLCGRGASEGFSSAKDPRRRAASDKSQCAPFGFGGDPLSQCYRRRRIRLRTTYS
jgi:hypothetical protein